MISVIIVDYKKDNPLLKECLDNLQKQTYLDFEVILLTDQKNNLKYPKLHKKNYGKYIGPAEKRNDGVKMAKGEIAVFIDDDAYPEKNWLRNIYKNFRDKNIVAVGGPGTTPPGSSWREEASGWFSASPLGGGPFCYRFLPEKTRFVDDYPSMNLAVRKKDFLAVGGFDSHFWPGEDTKLCLDLIRGSKKIIYDPKVLVYHHRRPLWKPHFRQNGNYGLHRGYFARVLPQTSFRWSYFAPPALVLSFPVALFFYLPLLLLNAVWVTEKSQSVFQGIVSIPVTAISHFWYGVRFIQGFFTVNSEVVHMVSNPS